MKNKLAFLMAVLSFLLILGTSQANAYSITPGDAILWGDETGVPDIEDAIDAYFGYSITEDLILTGFWPSNEAISPIPIYNGVSIPEPQTMLLLGAGLLGLAVFGRKKFKKD